LKKINILQLSSRADAGGGPMHIFNLISSIDKFNFYIGAPKSGFFTPKFKKYSKGYIDLPYRSFSIKSLVNLIRAIKKWDIDLIHSHGRGAGIFSRIAGALTNVPVIHTHHGFFFEEKPGIKKMFQIVSEFILNELTSHIIFVSSSEYQNYVQNSFFTKIKFSIIPNGIFIPKNIRKKKKNKIINLIAVTRLESEKGNDFLLLLMTLLLKKNTNIKLRIVGDGPLRTKLEFMTQKLNIQNHVDFLGVRSDVPSLLQKSDIFISCSPREAQGIAVLEAMSYQLPVVASNVSGHKDSIISGTNGLLFDLNSPYECSDIINMLILNPNYTNKLAKNARKHAIKNFSINNMSYLINKTYSELRNIK
jgi:glycosyltransferase involved in cell wall biosynthesis